MILEGIVTTISTEGAINIAPMGPRVDAAMQRIVLRPFVTSHTYRNLKAHGEGVLHVTDDVLLLARAAIGAVDPRPALVPATRVNGWILADACRYYEFKVSAIDERAARTSIEAEVVHRGTLREFFGFNRAMFAVVEAAILATRTAFLPISEIAAEYDRLVVLVEKTGGPREREAFQLLRNYVTRAAQSARGEQRE